jgi:hypothetical protein
MRFGCQSFRGTRQLGAATVALAFAVALLPSRGNARPDLLLSTYPDAFYCSLGPGDYTPTIYVIWSNWSGAAKSVAFGAALSPNSGYSIAYYGSSTYTLTGDPASGFVVDFGSCHQGSAVLMQFVLVPTSPNSICPSFQLTPHPSYGGIRYAGCDGILRRAERSTGMLLAPLSPGGTCPVSSVPYDPYPTNGATNVSVSMSLEWSFDEPQCGDISGREDDVYFGTTPTPPFLEIWGDEPYPLKPLQPSTTYYWQVRTRAYGLFGVSPVWSFTTTATVATRPTTWGAVKALYR